MKKMAEVCTVRHFEETGDALDFFYSHRKETNRVMQKLMLEDVLRLQVDRESKKREFRLRPDMVRQASRLMVENQMLGREVTYEELVSGK